MKDFIEVEKDTCIDKIDERDYEYSGVLWISKLRWSCIIDLLSDYQNQKLEDISKFMCVYFTSSHNSNIMNNLEKSEVRTSWKELWLEAIKMGMLDINSGTYLVNWPKFLKKKGLITGYVKVNTLEEIKHSIFNNRPVSVWSNKIKWSIVKKPPFIVEKWDSYWHAFVIIWYDDEKELFTLKNSYWKESFDNGRFYLRYDDLNILYPSKYSLIDSVDPIIVYKKKIMEWINIPKAQEAFELGLWNWKDATKPASREEVATMILRGLEKLKEWKI